MLNKYKLLHISIQISLTYFISLILGIILHIIYPLNLIPEYLITYFSIIGFILLIIGTFLFFVSHICRVKLYRKEKNVDFFTFYNGPYKIIRHPIYLSKLILISGLALMVNSLSIIILVLIAFIFTFLFFRKKEDIILEKEWGENYHSYKEKVKI